MNSKLNIEFSDEALDQIADELALRLRDRLGGTEVALSGWLDSNDAAAYLGISRNALHKLTSERMLDFSQRVAGGTCFFRVADLDRYREQFMRGGSPA